MSSSTALPPPPTLPFPIVIQALKIAAGTELKRGDILLHYTFEARDPDDRTRIQKRVGSWECPIEGKLVRWATKVGDLIPDARKPLLHILEPCTHAVQLEGLCALCGKDLTTSDYLGPSQASRASIRMSHDTTSVLDSLEEASRLDTISTSNLLSTRRLSLIVDLDQTIIHATVDPTVGDWMNECGLLPDDHPGPSSNGKGKEKAKQKSRNPNEDALRDVGRFKLGPAALGGRVEDDCWYYIKPRPGLPKFLKELSKLYEMHVYTMGTRAYAEKVCGVIDPKGEIFGRRILSRDESGSLTAKSIARLFPVDTSMVVIIDDRSDVWEGSRNLVKVVPYDFFVGIGDINSSFLPKLKPSPLAASTSTTPSSSSSAVPAPSPASPPSETTLVLPTAADTEHLAEAQLHVIEDQIGERSLAKQQEKLEAEEEEASGSGSRSASASVDGESESGGRGKALLKSDDDELERLDGILREIHQEYYESHDRRAAKLKNGALPKSKCSSHGPDVKNILDELKTRVLRNCRLVFSGVIPLGAKPESTEIWRTSESYGAFCETQLSDRTTHLLAKQEGTQKVIEASRPPYSSHVHIVHPSWLLDSIAQFRRLDEDEYLLIPPTFEDPPSAGPRSTTPPLPPTTNGVQPAADAQPAEGQPGEDNVEDVNGDLDLGEIDWGQADRELDEFLDESSDDGGSGNVSEAESVSSSRSTSLNRNPTRKRPRPSSGLATPTDPTSSPPLSRRPSAPIPKRSRMETSSSRPDESEPPSSDNIDVEGSSERGDDEDEGGESSDGTGTEGGDDGEMEEWARELEGSFGGGAS